MDPIQTLHPPPLQTVTTSWSEETGITLRVLRLDLVDPFISGNKWYKLRLNLSAASEQGYGRILSFGGAWSNHLYALSAAANRMGIQPIGVVRGELSEPLNPVLRFARQQGMVLHPLDRATYRAVCTSTGTRTSHASEAFLGAMRKRYGDFHVIPEGGSNHEGVLGCAELSDFLPGGPDAVVALACGTGTTLAGLIAGFSRRPPSEQARLLGVPVIRGGDYLAIEIERLLKGCGLSRLPRWQLASDFHCGGYARSTPELMTSIKRNATETGLPLEPVYTGKLFYALEKMAQDGRFPRGTNLTAVHTGGIIPDAVENFPT